MKNIRVFWMLIRKTSTISDFVRVNERIFVDADVLPAACRKFERGPPPWLKTCD